MKTTKRLETPRHDEGLVIGILTPAVAALMLTVHASEHAGPHPNATDSIAPPASASAPLEPGADERRAIVIECPQRVDDEPGSQLPPPDSVKTGSSTP